VRQYPHTTAPPRRAAASKLHETGLPQKAAEHRDAAGARASDFTTQVSLAWLRHAIARWPGVVKRRSGRIQQRPCLAIYWAACGMMRIGLLSLETWQT